MLEIESRANHMAVMMQAFYWDAPKHEKKEHEWWNFVAEKVEDLGKAGINALWLPPVSKESSNTGMGYAPYDYFDLGDFDQKGGMKTWYGNRAELEALIAKAHKNGIGLYADMVINHNSGADEEEVNPLDGQKRWTKFNPKSGRFPRDWNCFHPSRYEQVMIEGENFAGFPHLCHRNPLVYTEMFNYARMLIEELGFDGFRFDFAKGFGAWMIGVLAKYRYVKDGEEFTPYVVAELWSGTEDIDNWLDQVNSMTDNQIAAFDFPLRYKLKDVCDTPNYDLRNLTDGGAVVMKRPMHAATFVDNHDMGDNMIVNDKLMAYSFIMVHEGYPCIFWYDYYNNQLDAPRHTARHQRADPGAPQIRRRRLADTSRRPRPLHHAARRLEGRQDRAARAHLRAEQPRRQMVRHIGEDEVAQSEVRSDRMGRPSTIRGRAPRRTHHRWRRQRRVPCPAARLLPSTCRFRVRVRPEHRMIFLSYEIRRSGLSRLQLRPRYLQRSGRNRKAARHLSMARLGGPAGLRRHPGARRVRLWRLSAHGRHREVCSRHAVSGEVRQSRAAWSWASATASRFSASPGCCPEH